MEVIEEQPQKAELPIEVTLLGIEMEVSPEQPRKASLPIEVTLLPIVIFFKLLLFAKGLNVLVEFDLKMFRPR